MFAPKKKRRVLLLFSLIFPLINQFYNLFNYIHKEIKNFPPKIIAHSSFAKYNKVATVTAAIASPEGMSNSSAISAPVK